MGSSTYRLSFSQRRALVAQMVERKTLNLVVVGSSPTEGVFFIKQWSYGVMVST
jgi:hypothetical protein